MISIKTRNDLIQQAVSRRISSAKRFVREGSALSGLVIVIMHLTVNRIVRLRFSNSSCPQSRKIRQPQAVGFFWQMTIIRIPNRNEDFAVNPLGCRGVHLWFRVCRSYCLLFFKLTYITVLVKRFIQKHHSCHQDQQTTGQHHQ